MNLGLRRLRDVPLFWKMLVPFLGLVVVIGLLGSFITVRNLSMQAQAKLDQELLRDSLEARSFVHDQEFYLLETANFAANLEGMSAGISARDPNTVERLLRSVIALKSELDLLVVVGPTGRAVVEFVRPPDSEKLAVGQSSDWSGAPLVQRALHRQDAELSVGLLTGPMGPMLGVAGPVCADPTGCSPTGVALAGLRLDTVLSAARLRLAPAGSRTLPDVGIALYDATGAQLAAEGQVVSPDSPVRFSSGLVRRRATVQGRDIETLYAPFKLGDSVVGHIGVSRPTAAAFASARSTGQRLALLVLLAMLGVVIAGAALTRFILGQIRPLVAKSRAFGEGDLSARAPVVARDELGELAAGFNQMADQIQAGYETLEQRVTERTEEIQRLMEQRAEFFTGVSHEFRTALAVIRGEAALLRDPTYARTSTQRTELANTLDGASGQLLAFINDVLELARAEAGNIEIETENIDPASVLADLRRTAKTLAGAGGLDFSFRVERSLPHVRANAVRLREVVLGLIDNAVKYTPAGGGLELGGAAHNGEVLISVTDTGPGIPPEAGEHVFDAFYRVKGSQAKRGEMSSGLGLAIARHLVEAQGGRIWFDSVQGEGTTFTVAFPCVRPTRRGAKRRRSA